MQPPSNSLSENTKPSTVDDVRSHYHALLAANNIQAAYHYAQDACHWFPDDIIPALLLGNAALLLKNFSLAKIALLRGHQHFPNDTDILLNLFTCFYEENNIADALFFLHKAQNLAPHSPEVIRKLGIVAYDSGNYQEAINYFNELYQEGANPEFEFSLGLCYLGNGNFEQGWRHYEARLNFPGHTYTSIKTLAPRWVGEDLNDKTLLIIVEQGLGDTIQFMRYIKELKKRYIVSVIFACQPPLCRLAQHMGGVDRVILPGDEIPFHQYSTPLLSLPLYLQLFKEADLVSPPYLRIHHLLTDYWKRYFAKITKLKVGIVWSSQTATLNSTQRNCNLSRFILLMKNKNIQFISLQKEMNAKDREILASAGIDNLGSNFADLADTAAAIQNLDLVISIDTAVSHLAGALGKLTWLLLPAFHSEWRYSHSNSGPFWYPSMEIFRQPAAGDWNGVFKAIEAKLAALALRAPVSPS